jgi:hypothetical protein
MDDFEQCGNDLRFLEWWLHNPGPKKDFTTLSQVAAILQGVSQVLISARLGNQALAREFRAESAKALVSAANQFAGQSSERIAA